MRRGCAWLVVAGALVVTACTGPSLDELTESADSLAVPANWEFVAGEVRDRPCLDPVENCPKVDRTYRVPGTADFATVITQTLEDAGFDVWNPAGIGCGPNPRQGCSVGARRDNVSVRATVADIATDS